MVLMGWVPDSGWNGGSQLGCCARKALLWRDPLHRAARSRLLKQAPYRPVYSAHGTPPFLNTPTIIRSILPCVKCISSETQPKGAKHLEPRAGHFASGFRADCWIQDDPIDDPPVRPSYP